MILLDRIKIITDSVYISNIDSHCFICESIEDTPISYTYSQMHPCLIYVKKDIKQHKLIVEFTGKILLDRSHELINAENIRDCLHRIVEMGICELDIDNIIRYGKIGKCDVTMDVSFDSEAIPTLLRNMRQSLRNYLRWQCDVYSNNGDVNGMVIHNTARTRKHKRRLCIYDKAQELHKAENHPFLNSLADRDAFLGLYTNILRFELNLVSMEQIRRSLNIESVTVMSVLSANPNPNPIHDFIDNVFVESYTSLANLSQRDNERLAFIRQNGNDIRQVEEAVRAIKAPTVSISRAMQPYRRLFAIGNQTTSTKRTLLDLVA